MKIHQNNEISSRSNKIYASGTANMQAINMIFSAATSQNDEKLRTIWISEVSIFHFLSGQNSNIYLIFFQIFWKQKLRVQSPKHTGFVMNGKFGIGNSKNNVHCFFDDLYILNRENMSTRRGENICKVRHFWRKYTLVKTAITAPDSKTT